MTRLRWLLLAVLALLFVAATPAVAQSATLSVAFSPDPTEDIAVTVTASGTADVSARLYVFAIAGSSACPSTASGLSIAYELSGGGPWSGGGDAVAAGAFSRSYTYKPSDATAYRVCAYLAATPTLPPQASGTGLLMPREPVAEVAVAESSDATEEEAVTYTVTGSTEVARRLYVFATQSSSGCPARVWDMSVAYELSGGGPWSGGGDPVAAGAFQRTYSYTPRDSGTVQVCAYVSESPSDTPNATGSRTTTVREPTATLTVTAPSTGTRGQPVSIAVSGDTEQARRLYVFATPGASECPARAWDLSIAYELSGGGPWSGGGDAIAAGPVSRTYSFTPTQGGTRRICAYVTESSSDTPHAAAGASVEVHDPDAPPSRRPTPSAWKLGIDVPATVHQGERVPIRLTGQAVWATSLLTFVGPSSTACKRTAWEHSGSAGVKAVSSVPQAAGDIATSASFGPAAAGTYRVCSYLTSDEDSVPQKLATAMFTILPDPALVPVLVSASGEEHRDRLVLVWKRGANDENDTITVYLSDPAAGAEAHWSGVVDGGDARVSRPGPNYRAVLPHVGYRKFWWTITRPGPYRSNTVSETRTARVIPRPIDRAAARASAKLRLSKSSKRPGSAHVIVRSSPRAKVTAVVRQTGRVVKRWTFTGNFEARNTLRLALSCTTRGPYRAEIAIVDPYGARVTRRVSWNITGRCDRLRAAERRRAEARRRAAERRREAERRRREAERRRQETPAPPSSGGGNPYAGMNCSEIGHDFWVTPGSDPEHDADGDGHACESYA